MVLSDTNPIVEEVLFQDTTEIRLQFRECIAEYLPSISQSLAVAVNEVHDFEKFVGSDENREKVGHILFGAVQGTLVSMRLFLEGLLIQSGNTQRQVIESIALAVLCSKPELGYIEKFSNGQFSSNKALDVLLRKAKELGLNKSALSELKKSAEFYHKFSHPTLMTIALNSSFSDPSNNYYGGHFDSEKEKQYIMEAKSRSAFLKTFPNLVSGIKQNMSKIA